MAKKTLSDIPDVLPLLSDAGGSAADAVNANNKDRTFVTKGEKIHKWATYLSVDWVFNATVGAIFAYWGKFTESGHRMWRDPINKGFETVLKPFFKNPEYLKESVKQGNTFMSIIAGGMFTIPPLLVLENSKVKKSIVKFFDKMIYGKDKVENDPKFQQAYDEIHEAPKKDFWTGMTSRFAALAPLLALVLIPQTKDLLVKYLFTPVGKGSKFALSKVGLPAERLFKKFPEAERAERWKYVHEDAVAMDLSFGLPYAVLHSITYNAFANMKGKKKDKKEESVPDAAPKSEPTINIATVTEAPTDKKFTEQVAPATSHVADIATRRAEAEAAPNVSV